ncbi:MAG: CDP-alcohol phosphatidyltransferase family protein [Candidatus Lokiarchaeota archaeon]|nr:CDP-alcohol phosphatidyltransferase family protein [Candidatus Harpocratesius repetitus]
MKRTFRLRPIFAPIVKFLAKIAINLKITPNFATWLMVSFSLISSLGLLFFQSFIWFGVWIFLTGLLDGIDGAIARMTKKTSKFGGFFDSTMDRISESIILSGLILFTQIFPTNYSQWILLLTIIGFIFSYLISYSRARAELELKRSFVIDNDRFSMNIGILARSERLFYLFIMSCIVQFTSPLILLIFMGFYVVLTAWTFLERFFTYKSYLNEFVETNE